MKSSIFSYNYQDLRAKFEQDGRKLFLADQVFDWLYKKFEFDVSK